MCGGKNIRSNCDSQFFKILLSYRNMLSRQRHKDSGGNNSRTNIKTARTFEINWSHQCISNEVDKEVSYLESTIVSESTNDEYYGMETCPTRTSRNDNTDESCSYCTRSSSHQYLRKSKQNDYLRVLFQDLDKPKKKDDRRVLFQDLDEPKKKEGQRVQSNPQMISRRERKRKERQSNRSGIPSVINLNQPLLPARTTRTTTLVYLGNRTRI